MALDRPTRLGHAHPLQRKTRPARGRRRADGQRSVRRRRLRRLRQADVASALHRDARGLPQEKSGEQAVGEGGWGGRALRPIPDDESVGRLPTSMLRTTFLRPCQPRTPELLDRTPRMAYTICISCPFNPL